MCKGDLTCLPCLIDYRARTCRLWQNGNTGLRGNFKIDLPFDRLLPLAQHLCPPQPTRHILHRTAITSPGALGGAPADGATGTFVFSSSSSSHLSGTTAKGERARPLPMDRAPALKGESHPLTAALVAQAADMFRGFFDLRPIPLEKKSGFARALSPPPADQIPRLGHQVDRILKPQSPPLRRYPLLLATGHKSQGKRDLQTPPTRFDAPQGLDWAPRRIPCSLGPREA